MKKLNAKQQVAIDALIETFTKKADAVKSVANKTKVARIVQLMRKTNVAELVLAQNVQVERMTKALYTTQKAMRFFDDVSSEYNDFEKNLTACVKTAINAKALSINVTKDDIRAAISNQDVVVRDHVYRTSDRIADESDTQVNYCINALHTMNLIKKHSDTIFEVQDCKLLEVAKERLAQVVV